MYDKIIHNNKEAKLTLRAFRWVYLSTHVRGSKYALQRQWSCIWQDG